MRATLIIYFPKTSPRGISELKRGLRISPESHLFPRWCRRGDSTAWALASQAIGLGGAASGWRAPVRRAYPPVRRRPKPVRVPMEHQMKRKKEPTDFSGLLRVSSGAEGGTRTPTGFPTTPSRWRVCQFHHFGTLQEKHLSGPPPENQAGVSSGAIGTARTGPQNNFPFSKSREPCTLGD